MTFTDNIKKIEQIKKDYKTKHLKQETLLFEPISNISKAAVNDEVVSDTFAKLVSYYLSKSDFDMFNKVLMDNEIDFISNSIGYGDIIQFLYDDKKQVNIIKYQNADKLISVTLKSTKDRAYVEKTVKLDDRIHETKTTFRLGENGYYQESFVNRLIKSQDGFTTCASDIYRYDINEDELTKEFKVVTRENGKVVSKSSISNIVDKNDYIVEEGRFYTINKKQENKKMIKCKKLENDLLGLFK